MDATSQQGSSPHSFGRQEPDRDEQGRTQPWREADGRGEGPRAYGSMTPAGGGLRESVDSFVSRGKEQVVEQVDATARALHSAAGNLEEEQPHAARLTHSVAGQIDRASTYLRDMEPGRVLGDLQQFARREPAMFIAGAALAGLLLGRFLKASGSRSHADDYGYPRAPHDRGSNRPPENTSAAPFASGGPVLSAPSTGPTASPGTTGEM